MTTWAMRFAGGIVAAAGVWPAPFPRTQNPTFRSSTEVVLVPVWVHDGNRPVSGLKASDFQLLDQGVPQEISAAAAASQPVDVTLVLDTSGSMKGANLDTLKAGVQQISQSLTAADTVRLVTFATTIGDPFGVQPGGAVLPVDRIEGGGATSLYDGLAAALMSLSRSDRPQLVFSVSDGRDTLSFLDAGQLVSLAGSTSASLYVTLVQPARSDPVQSPVPLWIVEQLREAAVRTGGLLYENPPGAALPVLFKRALDDFRTSYLLTFTPQGVPRGGWHEIVVRTTDRRYSIRARKGYQS